MMGLLFGLIGLVLYLFLIALVLRLVIEWVQVFARQWQPHGFVLLVFSLSRKVTDPVLVPIRKAIPALRLGGVSVDVSLLIVVVGLTFLMNLVASIAQVV